MTIKKGLSKQKLNQILKKWQKKLRLTDWNLSIKIIEFKRKDYRQSGDIKVSTSKKKATILLTNNPFRDEEKVIVHELVHLLLWDFDHFCEKQILKTCKKFEGAHDKYMKELERTVGAITKTMIKK